MLNDWIADVAKTTRKSEVTTNFIVITKNGENSILGRAKSVWLG
jgi:hypothetical protein